MGKLYIYCDTKEDIFIDLVHHLGRKMEAIRQKQLIPTDGIARSRFTQKAA